MAKIKGIDISYYEGDVNFKKVMADGIKFIILREGYRKTIDSKFLEYVKKCKNNKIPIMVYHFIYIDGATIAQNAKATVKHIKQAGLDPATTWIAADLEYDTWAKCGKKCTKAKCTKYTKRYLNQLKKLGCKKLFIYTNVDYYENYYDWKQLKGYPIWLADYTGEPDHSCAIHQYSEKGTVDGIKTKVDMNYLLDKTMFNSSSTSSSKKPAASTSKIEKATKQMETWANDKSHGYDQTYRWGQKGDYDCSAAVIQAWQNAGVPVKTKGASYTGDMLAVFKKCGFKDITSKVNRSTGSGLVRGDILLSVGHHVAMYCGNKKEVEASINEKGTATGGKPGDQTGKEFLIRSYRNYPWTNVLRYQEAASSTSKKKTLKQIAKEVINGLWGSGAARKKKLKAAGYDPKKVQEKVNELLK